MKFFFKRIFVCLVFLLLFLGLAPLSPTSAKVYCTCECNVLCWDGANCSDDYNYCDVDSFCGDPPCADDYTCCTVQVGNCTGGSGTYPCPDEYNPCINLCDEPLPTPSSDPGGGDDDDDGGGGGSHMSCVGSVCTSVSGSGSDECTQDSHCYNVVAGGVYVDPNATQDAFGECHGDTTTLWTGGDSPQSTVSLVSGRGSGGNVSPNGSYVITGVPGGNVETAVLTIADPNWFEACSSQTFTMPHSDKLNVNLFVSDRAVGWWQSRGGDVGANTGGVRSQIPVSCAGVGCEPYVSLYDAVGTLNSSGVVTYASAGVNFGAAGGDFSEGVDIVAEAIYRTSSRREGYAYFFRLFEMGLNPADDFPVKENAGKPGSAPANDRAYFANGDMTIGTDWNVGAGEEITVFVEGNLIVAAEIQVANGGFLAFVVSGNISFDPALGSADPASTIPVVEGVYIADGVISTGESANKLVGEGIFVGWSGVNLQRDFGNDDNNTNPAELFVYRPDFLVNAPDRFKKPIYRWEEVAP